jgi:phytoene desaturase
MRAIIVGAGPGGLATAINLAGQGIEVTVVEKEDRPGGRMRGLSFDGYTVDTGPSILQLPGIYRALFDRAGKRIEDYVTLVPLHPNTRLHFWDGSQLDTFTDRSRMRDELVRLSPTLGAAYDRWMTEGEGKYTLCYEKFLAHPADDLGYYSPLRLFPTLQYKPWQTLYNHLDGFFHDDRVTYALSYPSKYLGLHPTTCSSVFSVIPYMELAFGVWHVKGGFRELARGLQRCAQDLGATFHFDAPVKQVLVDAQGTATGVALSDGRTLTADVVVVNADLPEAVQTLVPPKWFEGTRLSKQSLAKAKYSCSTFMLYLGLDKVYDDLPHHLIYLSENARRTDRAALEDLEVDLDDPPFYVCNPTPTDNSGAPAGHSTLYVLVPTPNTSRPVDWKQTEAAMREKIPQWLEKVGLREVAKHIVAQRSFTAETWRDAFNVFRGAVFNLSHTWLQLGPMRPHVKSPHVEGLYWVGGGAHPGSGLLTIMESANIAADFVLKKAGGTGLPRWPFVPPLPDSEAGAAPAAAKVIRAA